jgi:hypothetical protein
MERLEAHRSFFAKLITATSRLKLTEKRCGFTAPAGA